MGCRNGKLFLRGPLAPAYGVPVAQVDPDANTRHVRFARPVGDRCARTDRVPTVAPARHRRCALLGRTAALIQETDAVYAMAGFDLADDEALLLRGRSPGCTF